MNNPLDKDTIRGLKVLNYKMIVVLNGFLNSEVSFEQ